MGEESPDNIERHTSRKEGGFVKTRSTESATEI